MPTRDRRKFIAKRKASKWKVRKIKETDK